MGGGAFMWAHRALAMVYSGLEIEAGWEFIYEGVYINEKKFFKTVPLSQLPKDQVEISSLKGIIGNLLYNHIRSKFPRLV